MRALNTRRIERADAESIAIDALAYVAGDERLLPRFLAMSGIDAGAVRHAAREPGFLAGVLRFVTAHEPTLIAFSQACGHDPAAVATALRALPFGEDAHDGST